MFDQKLLTARLRQLGGVETAPLVYEMPTAHPEIAWSVDFRLLGAYRWELDGALRRTHQHTAGFAHYCMVNFAGANWINHAQRSAGAPLFNFMPWGDRKAFRIQGLTADEAALTLAGDLQLHVLPFITSITNDSDLLQLLESDHPPYEWLCSQPLFRLAEATYLAVKLGVESRELEQRIVDAKPSLQHQLTAGISVEQYAREVRDAAFNAVRARRQN